MLMAISTTLLHPGVDRQEYLCTQAMLGCQSSRAAFEILPNSERVKRMMEMAVTTDDASVLEHAVFTFGVQGISRACSHQLVRHRIASYSQQSQRHVDPTKDMEWFVTPPSIEGNTKTITPNPDSIYLEQAYRIFMSRAAEMYAKLVAAGIPAEDARFCLTNACKTNIVITMNCRELRHFFKLRLAKKAQWEIRAMATEMWKLVVQLAPTIFGEFREAVESNEK